MPSEQRVSTSGIRSQYTFDHDSLNDLRTLLQQRSCQWDLPDPHLYEATENPHIVCPPAADKISYRDLQSAFPTLQMPLLVPVHWDTVATLSLPARTAVGRAWSWVNSSSISLPDWLIKPSPSTSTLSPPREKESDFFARLTRQSLSGISQRRRADDAKPALSYYPASTDSVAVRRAFTTALLLESSQADSELAVRERVTIFGPCSTH